MTHKYKYHEIEYNYEILRGKKVIIWCRSVTALQVYKLLRNLGIEIIGFTDSFVQCAGGRFAGLPVYTFGEIQNMKEVFIYVATSVYQYQQEILEKAAKLKNANVYTIGRVSGAGLFDVSNMKQSMELAKDKIQCVRENLMDGRSEKVFDKLLEYRITNNRKLIPEILETEHPQYFPTDIWMCRRKEEIFIDAGAHDGATSWDFCNWTKGTYSKIYMMEPDPLMFEIMKEYVQLNKMENTIPVNCGAYSYTGELKFREDFLTGSSRITEEGETVICVVSIDDMLQGEKVTFIKMDIEGAEMDALIGAQNTIKKYRPRLAISIYHKADDLWEIPFYILSHYPWYKIYLRHYALTTNETVMYAIP